MSEKLKKRICFFGIAGFLFLFMVGETFAYNWTQIEEVLNEFQTGTYDTELVEEFTAPSDWLPGVEVNKDVSVLNEGTIPVYAKIEISQKWVGTEEMGLTFAVEEGGAYAAIIVWGEDVVLLSSGVSDFLGLGIPTVNTIEEAQGKWLLLDETPNEEGSYTFYYIGVLYEGDETPLLIEAVELNPAIEADILEKHTVWDMQSQELVTTITENSTYDYEESSYILTVHMYTVQATSDAIGVTFASDTTKEQATIVFLQSISVTGEDVTYSRAEVDEKILYITEEDGELTYTPSSPDENWFLSFLNMLPGETYTDTLLIENLCDSAYDIYMQAIYKGSQSELAEELLEYISMKVYFNGELIYEGSANGEDNIGDLFQVIYLGNYESGTTGTIYVELTLDPDTPIEYAGILGETNWQFMIGGETEEIEEPEETNQPKTGDESNSVVYVLSMLLALLGMVWCVKKGLGIKE